MGRVLALSLATPADHRAWAQLNVERRGKEVSLVRAYVKGKVEEVGQGQGCQAKHPEQHGKGSQPRPLEFRQVKGGIADEDACMHNQQT